MILEFFKKMIENFAKDDSNFMLNFKEQNQMKWLILVTISFSLIQLIFVLGFTLISFLIYILQIYFISQIYFLTYSFSSTNKIFYELNFLFVKKLKLQIKIILVFCFFDLILTFLFSEDLKLNSANSNSYFEINNNDNDNNDILRYLNLKFIVFAYFVLLFRILIFSLFHYLLTFKVERTNNIIIV